MTSATSGLREVAAAWITGAANGSEVVQAAANLLVGENDPIALPIAILPADPDSADLRVALEAVFESADDVESLRGHRALELALRWQCRQYRVGARGGHDLTRWAHGKSNHEGPASFEPFEILDDYFDDGMTETVFITTLDSEVDNLLNRTEPEVS